MTLDPMPDTATLLRLKAEREARRAARPTVTAPEPAPRARRRRSPAPDAHVTEIMVQTECLKELKKAGWLVWRVGQRNAKGTQDAGVSDLIAMRERLVMIEMKRPVGGEQSPAQRAFQAACEAAGVEYRIARRVNDVRDLLTEKA